MRSTEASVFVGDTGELGRFLPEGPRTMVVDGIPRVLWVNIQDGVNSKRGWIHLAADIGRSSIATPGRVGFLLPVVGDNRLLLGMEKDLRVFTFGVGSFSAPLATIPDTHPRTIINDAEIVPGGKAVVFGTKDTEFKEPIAQLYLYTVDDNRISVLADKQTCSNGKVFASDDRGLILFDIDTPTRKVVRYRLDVAARRATPDGVAIDVTDQVGFPDGMRGCGDGTAIIAFYNPEYAEAGRAVRFDLNTGKAIEEWTTPGSPRVTCPLLVKRPDGVKLILTTATEGMPEDMRAKCPNAGSLFIADTQFADCPAQEVVHL